MIQPLLKVNDLTIAFGKKNQLTKVVRQISLNVYANQTLGIIGESGSGKSVCAMAILQLLPKNTSLSGEIIFENQNLLELNDASMQCIRAQQIAMVFQEPMSALNPSITCGKQVQEVLIRHAKLSKKEAKTQVLNLFEQVKLPDPQKIWQSYPHQISGGQKQRVIIAMAIACKPKILIADEPTTALDVTVQKEIIELLQQLQKNYKMAIIFISHDLYLVKNFCQNIIVMKNGQIVEQGSNQQIFKTPQHYYTKALLATKPPTHLRYNKLLTISDFIKNQTTQTKLDPIKRLQKIKENTTKPPLLELINVNKTYWQSNGFFGQKKSFQALHNITLKIYPNETLGLVGESGCGKSTLSNLILKLDHADSGKILYQGTNITQLSEKQFKHLRKDIQVIFQDPFASLNPKITIGNAILEPMTVYQIGDNYLQRKQMVLELLEKVGLQKEHFNRLPKEFSGGQRQRIGIARAIALQPKLLLCDESVSALDVSVQAQVLNLLNQLKKDYQFTYLFISHDLNVVKYMSDHVAVMQKGQIVEYNEADQLYQNPKNPYTKALLEARP